MPRHKWVRLAYDGRLAWTQPKRTLFACCDCGMEKDSAARFVSWVVGYRAHRGARYAQTATYLPTPACLGRLPTPAEILKWNAAISKIEKQYPSQARGYAL